MPIKKGTGSITRRRNKIASRKSLITYLSAEEYQRIQKAADVGSTSMSGFISRAALREADEILTKHPKK